MTQATLSPVEQPAGPPPAPLREQVGPLIRMLFIMTILTGVLFPLLLLGVAQLNPDAAKGSVVQRNGGDVGSELIAQAFTSPAYFHPRPSAAGDGYDPLASGGSNLAPNNPKYREGIATLVKAYREENKLSEDTPVPLDAVAASGSGLDPHISLENARLQLPRVTAARKAWEDDVRKLVAEHTRGRQFGFLGEPRVNVLTLNLALDRSMPLAR